MPSRSSTLRNSSGETLLSCATRRNARSTVVSSMRTPVSFANCMQRALGDHPLEQLPLEHVRRRRRDLRFAELHQHRGTLLVEVVLRDRLVVHDGDDPIQQDLAIRGLRGRGAPRGRRRAKLRGGRRALLQELRERRHCERGNDDDGQDREEREAATCAIVSLTSQNSGYGSMPVAARLPRGIVRRRKPGTLRRNRSSGLVPRRASPLSSSCTIHRRRRLLRRRRQAMQHHAQRPAVRIVLKAHQRLQRLALHQRVVPAAEERPLRVDRPLRRDVELLERR